MDAVSLAEQMLFTTIKIDTEDHKRQRGSGTGFFYRIDNAVFGSMTFIVTNKHVVENTKLGRLHIQRRREDKLAIRAGMDIEIQEEMWQQMWVGHPDPKVDISVCAFSPIVNYLKATFGFEAFYKTVGMSITPDDSKLKELSALEEVTFVGYPNNVWDTVNKIPVVRKGHTATPIDIDYEDKPQFLIDASVFGGSSGSPVFIYNIGTFSNRKGEIDFGARLLFVGVVAAVYFKSKYNDVISLPIPTNIKHVVQDHEMIDLGVVFKARTVLETISDWLIKLNEKMVTVELRAL